MSDLAADEVQAESHTLWEEYLVTCKSNGSAGDIELFDIGDMNDAAWNILLALIAMTEGRDLSVAEAHQMGEERARWKERAEAAEAERDMWKQRASAELSDHVNGTPCAEIRWAQEREALVAERDALTDRLALAFSQAAGVIRKEEAVSPYRKDMTPAFQRGLSSGYEAAAQIVEERAPVSPLAAALRLPEVAAMREALGAVVLENRLYGVTPDSKGAQVWFDGGCATIARTALAALEAAELRGAGCGVRND